MTDKNSFNGFAKSLEIAERYSQMPLQKRVMELRGLESNKKRLEEELKTTGDKLAILDSMPDVAGYKVAKDRIAMELLVYFAKGDSYAELLRRDYSAVILSRVELLRTAGLIELRETKPWPCVIVTERGQAGIKEYAKRKCQKNQ